MARRPRRTRTPALDFLLERDLAETVPCRDCGAAIGETCTRPAPHTGTPEPLTNLPAHHTRLRTAGHTQEGQPNQ